MNEFVRSKLPKENIVDINSLQFYTHNSKIFTIPSQSPFLLISRLNKDIIRFRFDNKDKNWIMRYKSVGEAIDACDNVINCEIFNYRYFPLHLTLELIIDRYFDIKEAFDASVYSCPGKLEYDLFFGEQHNHYPIDNYAIFITVDSDKKINFNWACVREDNGCYRMLGSIIHALDALCEAKFIKYEDDSIWFHNSIVSNPPFCEEG